MERIQMEHENFIRIAIELAITSGKKGNNSFGALLVYQNKVIATAENTEQTGEGYGHAEYNLAIHCAQQFPETVLQGSTFYTSATPCPRCTFSILALGIRRIVIGVSYEGFAKLIPEKFEMLSIGEIVDRLGLEDMEIVEPVLEEEGMRAFEYWGGEYHPLEELLENAKKKKESNH
jgi:tRNA(Arg) A34 adenosine deaminase TadA